MNRLENRVNTGSPWADLQTQLSELDLSPQQPLEHPLPLYPGHG